MPPPLLASAEAAASPRSSAAHAGDDASFAAPRCAAAPRELNTRTCGAFLAVAKDKLTARYEGAGAHANDVGAAQADTPVPNDVSVYYFELRVLAAGARGTIGVGFSGPGFLTSRQPGWEPNSYGYHGDDGKKFSADGRGEAFGPTFTTGDVVGAGIILSRGDIFFTKNGAHLGVAYRGVRLPLYPTIGLHSVGEAVCLNFGGEGAPPLAFDAGALAAEEAAAATARCAGAALPRGAAQSLVRDFLRHHGHAATLDALDAAAPPDEPPARSAADDALPARAHIRAALHAGDVDAAEAAIRAAFPALLPPAGTAAAGAAFAQLHGPAADVAWSLGAARYLEALRRGDAEGAIRMARAQLAPLCAGHADRTAALAQLAALLAYEDAASEADGNAAQEPHDGGGDAVVRCPLAHLLGLRQRAAGADVVNHALLRHVAAAARDGSDEEEDGGGVVFRDPADVAQQCALERALRQLAAVEGALREAAGGQGEPFRLREALLGAAACAHAGAGQPDAHMAD